MRPATALLCSLLCFVSSSAAPAGEQIYQSLCASCHGPNGEGVAGEHDEPLFGTRSLEALASYIERRMPEGAPEKCVGEDARQVANYIYHKFYSPEARTRIAPPKRQLARLTNRQYRESVADLVNGFTSRAGSLKAGGLRSEYFQSEGMNKKAKRVLERIDSSFDFDYGTNGPVDGISGEQFSIAWQGSLLAPDTGVYDFRLSTPNGARLYVNADLKAGDANLRDDSDARRHNAAIDLWVSSGEFRQETTRLFLLGGRAYPIRLDYFKYKDKSASLKLEWKVPHGEWSVLEGDYLSPESTPAVVVVTTPFPEDDSSMGFERGTDVSKPYQQACAQAAVEVASQIISRLVSITKIPENATNRSELLQTFAAKFAERAFRRPNTAEVLETYVAKQFASTANPEVGLKRALILILTSPRFLYPEADGRHDDYAVASRMALALWDSLPDEVLWQAAKRGELVNEGQLRRQAERMTSDPRARAKLKEFFHMWLMMDEGSDMTKDITTYPGFDAGMIADLRRSLDLFIDHVVWSEGSDYRELLRADYLFLNDRLAAFYGAATVGTNGFTKTVLPEGARTGVFTHPYVLSTLSYHRSSSPIHRGVFLTRNVLGRFLKPPPMAISFMDDRFDPSLTMREKVTELTKSDTCMGCHVTINPLGFSLENFDAAGRWRTTDNNKPVDATSDYETTDGKVLRLRGPKDVSDHAVSSQEARLGFIKHLFHFSIKQTPAAFSQNMLTELEKQFASEDCHIRNLLVEITCRTAKSALNPETGAMK